GQITLIQIILILFVIIQLFILSGSIGMILGIIYSKFKDLDYIWNFTSRIIFFITPIFYQIDQVENPVRSLILMNPVSYYFIKIKKIFLNTELISLSFFNLILATVLMLVISFLI